MQSPAGAPDGASPESVAFGTLLRRHRLAAELTQEQLAERAGLGVRSIGTMERGVPHLPRADTVQRLAAALALSPAARAQFAEAARRLRRAAAPPLPAAPSPAPASVATAELGDLAEALHLVTQAVARLRADNSRLLLPDALRVQALVATRQGRWEDAAHALEEGVAVARAIAYPYAEARLLQLYGAMQVSRGAPGPGRRRLEAARLIFERLGARRESRQVEEALA